MYHEILLPTDGSPGANAAIEHAMHVATQNDAVVHAVYVVEMSDLGGVTENVSEAEADPREGAQELLAPIFEAADEAGVPTTEAILEGQPHEELIRYARDHDVDLIVMGTHGKSGLSRVLLGSTAEKIVRDSPVPVLTVRTSEE